VESKKIKKYLPLFGLAGLLVVLVAVMIVLSGKKSVDFASTLSSRGKCNVGVVSIHGYLDTQRTEEHVDSLSIAQGIRSLALNNYKAIVLLIDSPGGSAAAAEEISRAVDEIKFPVVAFIRGSALSGGYWVAASADHIVALSSSSVGNVGATFSYLEKTDFNRKEGYTFQEIVSGEYKEVGNADKSLTPEYKRYLQDYTNDLFKLFADIVMKNRGLNGEQLALISDGKFYIADKAMELRLIDQIGGISEVKTYLAEQGNGKADDLLLCEPLKFE